MMWDVLVCCVGAGGLQLSLEDLWQRARLGWLAGAGAAFGLRAVCARGGIDLWGSGGGFCHSRAAGTGRCRGSRGCR